MDGVKGLGRGDALADLEKRGRNILCMYLVFFFVLIARNFEDISGGKWMIGGRNVRCFFSNKMFE